MLCIDIAANNIDETSVRRSGTRQLDSSKKKGVKPDKWFYSSYILVDYPSIPQ